MSYQKDHRPSETGNRPHPPQTGPRVEDRHDAGPRTQQGPGDFPQNRHPEEHKVLERTEARQGGRGWNLLPLVIGALGAFIIMGLIAWMISG